MKRYVAHLLLALFFSTMFLGCEPPAQTAGGPTTPPPPPGSASPPPPTETGAAPAQITTSQAPLPPETKFGVFAGDVNDLAARPAAPPAAPPAQSAQSDPNTERVKAQAGVGIKGRSLDQYEGVVVTPVKAYFAGKERAFFDIEFPGNYRLWRVDQPSAPKDFDDLKAKFLDPLGLTGHLPKLPQGHKYVWDAEKEELQVERPRPQ